MNSSSFKEDELSKFVKNTDSISQFLLDKTVDMDWNMGSLWVHGNRMPTDPESDNVAGCNKQLPSGWGDGYNSDSSRKIIYNPGDHWNTEDDISYSDDGNFSNEYYSESNHYASHRDTDGNSNANYTNGNRLHAKYFSSK